MKCLCGYEHQMGIDGKGKWQENLVGDEPFKKLCGDFRTLENLGEKDDTKIWICPKCGTLKADKYA